MFPYSSLDQHYNSNHDQQSVCTVSPGIFTRDDVEACMSLKCDIAPILTQSSNTKVTVSVNDLTDSTPAVLTFITSLVASFTQTSQQNPRKIAFLFPREVDSQANN